MTEARSAVLRAFARLLGLPAIDKLTQRGRDPETARFTLHLADGRKVRIGTVRVLRSQTELASALAVAIDCYPEPVRREDWQHAVAVLLTHGKEVDETPGETFADAVREWASSYSARATTDRDGAAPRGEPFTDNETLHITASGLARYVRREYSEHIKLPELRAALADLGARRTNVSYDRSNGRRSSTSYYALPTTAIEAP